MQIDQFKNYIISLDYSLTPKAFYENYLKALQKYFFMIQHGKEGESRLCLDLSGCSAIEGTVIPNLLITGFIIKKNTGHRPILYIPQNGDANLWGFLESINFFKINEERKIFKILGSSYTTQAFYKLPGYCTTTMLDVGLSEEQLSEILMKKYSDLFLKHLGNFVYFVKSATNKELYTVNILEVFCKQLCHNALLHGNSFCCTTMQVNKELKRIFISVSDCGIGMYKGVSSRIVEKNHDPILLPATKFQREKMSRSELDFRAILEGLVYRYDEEIYGLWAVLDEVMDMKGIIRFHSGKARITLSEIKTKELMKSGNKKEIVRNLYYSILRSNNVQETPYYDGTHIEIELPLEL